MYGLMIVLIVKGRSTSWTGCMHVEPRPLSFGTAAVIRGLRGAWKGRACLMDASWRRSQGFFGELELEVRP